MSHTRSSRSSNSTIERFRRSPKILGLVRVVVVKGHGGAVGSLSGLSRGGEGKGSQRTREDCGHDPKNRKNNKSPNNCIRLNDLLSNISHRRPVRCVHVVVAKVLEARPDGRNIVMRLWAVTDYF